MSRRELSDALDQSAAALQRPFVFCALALDLLVVLGCWGSPLRMAAVLVVCVSALVFHFAVFPRLARKVGHAKLRTLRRRSNVLFHVLKVAITGASPPTWAWLAVLSYMATGSGLFVTRWSVLVLMPIQVGFGLYFGTSWLMCLSLATLATAALVTSEVRWGILKVTVEEQVRLREAAERAHEQLRSIHDRVVQQEKLSSLGLLAAGVAHEVNNPLAWVKSNLTQLAHDLPRLAVSPALLAEYETEILPETFQGVLRVGAIVADLQRFARGDEEVPVEYDLNEEVRLAARMTHAHFRDPGVLHLDLGPLPHLTGFPRQVSQVLLNLLLNAAHAVQDGGEVRISSGADQESIWFEVADTGIGMSPEIQPKIFDPFFTTKRPGEGTGLGLAAVHGIVSRLGGRIHVESAPGQGASFRVWLPFGTQYAGSQVISGPRPPWPPGHDDGAGHSG